MKGKLNFIAGVAFGKHFLNVVFGLSRRIRVNAEVLDDLLSEEKAVIVCCWHGRLLFPFYDLKSRNPVGLAGLHEDAEIITRVGEKMGWKMIRGSSSEGGTSAFREMVKMITREKPLMLITPDGPKGPSREAKGGAIEPPWRRVLFCCRYPDNQAEGGRLLTGRHLSCRNRLGKSAMCMEIRLW